MISRKGPLLFLLLLSLSAALGISPPYIDVPFEPGANKTFYFTVIPHTNPHVALMMTGDLAQYISFPRMEARLRGPESFSFDVHFPQTLPRAGLFQTLISVAEVPEVPAGQKGAGVGAAVGVTMSFLVRIPYPGKYLEITKFSVANTPQDGYAPITLEAVHRGNETIANASAVFEVFDFNGLKIATIPSGGGPVKPGQKVIYQEEWYTGQNAPGRYTVNATLYYDGAVQRASTQFKVGAEVLEITNISVPDIAPGGIARFTVRTDSFWTEDIPGVFIEVNVTNRTAAGVARSESKTVKAWGLQDFVVFWDSKGATAGVYAIEVTAHYLGKTTTETTVLRVVAPASNAVPLPLVVGGVAAIILLYLAYRFLLPRVRAFRWGRKKKKGVAAELEVRGNRAGEPVGFVLHVLNNSGDAIEAEVVFEVFAKDGGGVASLKAGKQKIAAGTVADFSAQLSASKAKAGEYLASATLSYGDKEGVAEKRFSLREEEKAPWEKIK